MQDRRVINGTGATHDGGLQELLFLQGAPHVLHSGDHASWSLSVIDVFMLQESGRAHAPIFAVRAKSSNIVVSK